jgi:hypothetical protein
MNHESIDQILAKEVELIPSSGFLASVMEKVHEEATAPRPIPFPWVRALPGIILASAVFGWGAVELVRAGLSGVIGITLPPPQLSVAFLRPLEQAGWIAGALGASLLSWLLSRRIAGRSRLL